MRANLKLSELGLKGHNELKGPIVNLGQNLAKWRGERTPEERRVLNWQILTNSAQIIKRISYSNPNSIKGYNAILKTVIDSVLIAQTYSTNIPKIIDTKIAHDSISFLERTLKSKSTSNSRRKQVFEMTSGYIKALHLRSELLQYKKGENFSITQCRSKENYRRKSGQ